MKLLIAVITFVVIPFVFAENSPQRVTPSLQEESKPPKNQTQSNHENPGYVALTAKATTGDAVTNQPTTEDGEGNPTPTGKEGDGKPPWVAIISLIVSFGSAAVALRSMLQTDEMRKITERAYLAAEQWETEGDYIFCNVSNKGRTPATLLRGHTEFTLWADLSAADPEARRKVDRDFGEAELPAQVMIPMQVGTLSQAEWSAVKNERTLTLRVEAYIQYRDAFKEVRPMHFVMEYDARIRKFVIADKRTSVKERKEHPQ